MLPNRSLLQAPDHLAHSSQPGDGLICITILPNSQTINPPIYLKLAPLDELETPISDYVDSAALSDCYTISPIPCYRRRRSAVLVVGAGVGGVVDGKFIMPVR